MSARDDYPALTAAIGSDDDPDTALSFQLVGALNEIDRLRDWKAEADIVLAEWETVWEAAGRPGPLGGSKAANVRALFDTRMGGPNDPRWRSAGTVNDEPWQRPRGAH